MNELKTLLENAGILNEMDDNMYHREDEDSFMSWAIHKGDDYEKGDYSTDAPDGVYNVYFPYLGEIGKGEGVEVKNGQFNPKPTMRAVLQARNDVGYWGSFLESLEWHPEHDIFIAIIGS